MEDLIVSARVAAAARTRLAPRVALLSLAGALALAGCGSSSKGTTTAATPAVAPTSSTPATGAASTISLEANPEGLLKYVQPTLSAKAGSVSISFKNASPLSHNLTVADSSGAVVGATATFTGGARVLALNLKPGTYKFYCTVPGHRQAGMEGTLTVQ
jgi:plastocyanin